MIPSVTGKKLLYSTIGMGLVAAALPGCNTVSIEEEKPNIIVILADDMGYSDIGCYGGEIPTPNIDRLGENGIRFTQFYNGARCVPTRASILTGLYAHQAGLGSMVSPSDRPGYLGRLNESSATIAEMMKLNGYQTFMSGKWHVSHYNYNDPEPTLHRPSWPMQRGFDRFFGTLSGAGSFFAPVSLMRDNEFIEPGEDFYYTDAITENAVKFINEAKEDQPFLLYVAHVAPHWPLHAKEEHIKMFEDRYHDGWDVLRGERFDRMMEIGVIDERYKISERDEEVVSWENALHKEWEARKMAVYAAQVYSMDQGIGKILETLEEKGELDNTLIIFLSDNGACAETIQGQDTRHGYFENGGTVPEVMPGGPDTYAAYQIQWANAGNTPYRKFKKWTHEGGIKTPLIAHWPNKIKPNQINTASVGHIIDFMPTFIELAGGIYPDSLNGNALTPLEGKSMLPLFDGDNLNHHDILFWEHLGHKAVRDGDWKLVSAGDDWELYNLDDDPVEMNDLAFEFPEKVEEMADMWQQWAERANVID
ncbi:MAG: arylsulfatase [Bacteroidales bacterium]